MKPDEIDAVVPATQRQAFASAFLAEFLKDGFGAAKSEFDHDSKRIRFIVENPYVR